MQVEIPREVAHIYTRLSSKYSLGFEPVTVRGRELQFLTLTDIEPLIAGKDIFAESTDFPFWVKIWETSVVMADFMASLQPRKGRRVLELGAGLGVTGIVAAAFGHSVTLTDYQDEILDFPRISAAVNGCKEVACEVLDWTAPGDLGNFDCIIGSEILFHQRFFKPLLKVFRSYLSDEGVVYLAHDARRKSLGQFLSMCEKDYDIAVQRKILRSADESIQVLLTRLTPR